MSSTCGLDRSINHPRETNVVARSGTGQASPVPPALASNIPFLSIGGGWLAVLSLLAVCLAHAGEPDLPSPYDSTPSLHPLMDAVTFHHGFDDESLLPDMALGEWKPRRLGTPELQPGLLGRALVAGTGSLLFSDPGNWSISTRGALALWVCPVSWNHEQSPLTNLVLSQSAAFYLERQGPWRNPDGTWRRHECLLVGLQRGPKGSRSAGCRDWLPGEWHLLAVNWTWPELSLSVDGGDFRAVMLPGKPDPSLFGGLIVGSGGGDHTLIDELFCFNRPLTRSEVQDLFKAFQTRDK